MPGRLPPVGLALPVPRPSWPARSCPPVSARGPWRPLGTGGALLVAPVGGDPVLGPAVHLVGPDLDLDGLAVEPDHRGVQRLVEVELRGVDVVLEASLDRRPDGVDRAEGGPAVLLRLDDHPDADQVVELVELLAPDDHLLVDAPQVLRATGHLGVHPGRLQSLAHRDQHPGQELVAQRGPAGHHLLDLGVALGVERGEGQVLELPLHALDAQPMGQRRVDVERLLGRAALLPLGHDRQGPHVVQPVGQLDDQHPPVVGHGHEHLADGGGLLGLLGVELEAVELGDALHDQGHVGTEIPVDDLGGDPGVLDGVVQQGGGHRLGVETQVGDDPGDGDRVGDVGLARAAQLAGVGHGGRLGGPDDQRGVVPGVPRRKAARTGVSSSASAAGRAEPARLSSTASVDPSAGTGVARAMPTGYLEHAVGPALTATGPADGGGGERSALLALPLALAGPRGRTVPGRPGRALGRSGSPCRCRPRTTPPDIGGGRRAAAFLADPAPGRMTPVAVRALDEPLPRPGGRPWPPPSPGSGPGRGRRRASRRWRMVM